MRKTCYIFFVVLILGGMAIFPALTASGAPKVKTISARSDNPTSAMLYAEVNPNGLATKLWFVSCAANNSAPGYFPASSKIDVGSETIAKNWGLTVYNLKPATTYTFAARAENSAGQTTGDCMSFTTLPSQDIPTVKTLPASDVASTSATLKISVNPNGLATQVWFTACALPTDANFFPNTVKKDAGAGTTAKTMTHTLTGLKAGTVYKYQAWAQNSKGMKGGDCVSFTTAPTGGPPIVITLVPMDITSSTVKLKGTINPNGYATNYFFLSCDPSSSPSYFMNTPITSLASGTSVKTVTYSLANLKPNTTYKYLLRATNAGGMKDGVCVSFKTLAGASTAAPSVTTGAATGLTATSATLQATVNPNGLATTVQFGSCDAVGSPTYFLPLPTPPSNAGSGSAPKTLSFTLTELRPGITYNYQAIANNSAGLTKGACKSFTTSPSSPTGPPVMETLTATNVTATSATLRAMVNPNGLATTAIFTSCDSSSSPSYFSPTPAQSFPASNRAWSMTWVLSGLKPNTTYRFQVKGSNSAGDEIGGCYSFKTLPAAFFFAQRQESPSGDAPCDTGGIEARDDSR